MKLGFKYVLLILLFGFFHENQLQAQLNKEKDYTQYVNPFIGTSNFGTTNPGPIAVRGMANISPFNVAGPENLPLEKDSRWLSTPYIHENKFLTGFEKPRLVIVNKIQKFEKTEEKN